MFKPKEMKMTVKAGSLSLSYLLLVFSCFCMGLRSVCHAQNDTIKSGDVLAYSEKLMVSADGRFQLGFFNLSDLPNGYLGIWYTDHPDEKFWVANRETPISGANANLSFDADGHLKILLHGGGDPILLNPDIQKASNSIATLENSGNLAVKELNRDGTVMRVLWESFDTPTDTLFPGMKLGIDFRTGKERMLRSWLTEEIPTIGGFTLEYDHVKRTLVMRHRGNLYWRSGDAEDVAKYIPQNMSDGEFYYHYVSNVNESYFSYSVAEELNSSWVLKPDGRFTANDLFLTRSPDGGFNDKDLISIVMLDPNECQGFSSGDGCVHQETPKCRNRKDKFEQRLGYFTGEISDEHSRFDHNSSISIGDCWDQCWKNCSCVGFSILGVNGTGCEFWSKGAVFVQSYGGNGLDLYVSRLTFPTNPPHQEKWWIWLIASAAASLSVLLSGFLCYLRRKKMQKEKEESILRELTTSDGFNNKEVIIGFDEDNGRDLELFSFASILAATDNFSIENKLGQGGFGPVFKGKLPSGQEIAVKRLSRSSGQGLVEFKNELILIAKLQHLNLVRLLGCCVRGDEKMLIYEFMPNKSLDFFLFDPKRRDELDWKTRYNIIEGTAQGLLYLHRYSRVRIIHRDMKASNILLDNFMNPKISDFGMARIFGRNDAEANTNRVVGTYGYMSPEYAMEGNFSEKSDVYSFGVLLLEIVSGRRNTGYYSPENPLNLVAHAWDLWKDGTITELIDSTLLADETNRAQIVRCIHVALLCLEDSALDRPTMVDVLPMLTNQTVALPAPKRVSTLFRRGKKKAHSFEIKQQSSLASASITELAPR